MLEMTTCSSEERPKYPLFRRHDMGVRVAGDGKGELGMVSVEIGFA